MRKVDAALGSVQEKLEFWTQVLSMTQSLDAVSPDMEALIQINNDGSESVRIGYALLQWVENYVEEARLRAVKESIFNPDEEQEYKLPDISPGDFREVGLPGVLNFIWAADLESFALHAHYFGNPEISGANFGWGSEEDLEGELANRLIDEAAMLKAAALLADSASSLMLPGEGSWVQFAQQTGGWLKDTIAQARQSGHWKRLTPYLRRYLREEAVYSWLVNPLREGGSHLSALVAPLIQDLEIEKMIIKEQIERGLEGGSDVSAAIDLAERLQEALAHYGNYRELLAEITWQLSEQQGVIAGKSSLLGLAEPVNVIPDMGAPGQCFSTVVAFASERQREHAPRLIWSEFVGHLLKCPEAKLAVLVTDRWAHRDFGQFEPSMAAFEARGGIFLTLLAIGQSITVLSR